MKSSLRVFRVNAVVLRFVILCALCAAPLARAAGFTVGNLLVVRVGTGATALSPNGSPVFLDEYSPSGTLVQSIALPIAASGANRPLLLDGTAPLEGLLGRTTDGAYVTLAGYATTLGAVTTGLAGTTAAAVNRVIARIDASGTVNTTTALTDYASGGSPRSVTSVDGTAFWAVGSNSGVRYATLAATTSNDVSTTALDLRAVEICVSQLYASSITGALRVGTVGSGLPTTTGQTITNLPGFPTTGNPVGFFLIDQDTGVAGTDTLYVADEGGTIQKYSLVAGAWTTNGSIAAAGVRGITASISGGTVTLYGTTGGTTSTGGGALYKFSDATGYNGAISGSATIIATATANTAFRGVAVAPVSLPGVTTQPVNQTAPLTSTVTFTVATNGSLPQTFAWRKGGTPLSDGGVISGATTATLTLTNIAALDAGSYDVVVTNPIGSVTSNAATLTIGPTPATVTLGSLAAIYSGAPKAVTVTTVPAGLAVAVTYNGSATPPTAAGSYSVVATITDPGFTGSASGTLVIAKATATATLGNLSASYDGSPKAVTVTTSPAGLPVTVTYNGSATAPTNAGSYAVVATITDPNYVGSATGTLVIGSTGASLSFQNLLQPYTGAPRSVSVTTIPAGLSVRVTYNGSVSAPTNVGSYIVAAEITDPNYSGIAIDTLTITRPSATVSLGNLVQTYDGTPHPVSLTTSTPVTRVNVTYNGASTPPTNAGSYAVVATIDDPIYVGGGSATLLVNKADQTLTLSPITSAQVGIPVPLTATASSKLPVTFSIASGNATIADGNVTFRDAGPVTIRATQVGSDNFNSATADITTTATKQSQSITFAAITDRDSNATPFNLSASSSSGLPVTFTVVSGPATVADGRVSLTGAAGTVVIRATQAGTETFAAATNVERTFLVTQANVTRLVNVSTRASAGSGEQVEIAGFVVAGATPRAMLIRAIGPGLRAFGLTTALAAPRLDLFRGATLIASNVGWSTASNSAEIIAAATRSGAFPLTAGSADSVVLITLAPGAYTAVVSSGNATTGVSLVEVYDVSGETGAEQLSNLSTRAVAGAADNTLIAGLVVAGNSPKRFLIRAAGPSLAQFGVTGVLARPQLLVRAANGDTVAQNAGWSSSPDALAIADAAGRVGAFGFATTALDAAALVTLPPGNYSVMVTGVGGTTGVALVEIYDAP